MSNRHSVTAPTGYSIDGSVLVIEDEMVVMFIIEDNLVDLGCKRISCASTTVEAEALIDSHAFDGAVLDLNLGGQSSEPVARLLVQKGIPFFFCTGHGDEQIPGFTQSVLRKPFSRDEFTVELSKILPNDELQIV